MPNYIDTMHQMLAQRSNDVNFVVAALYKFVDLHADEVETVQRELETLCGANQIQGTLLIANEGLNGTVAGCLLYTSPSPRDATLSRMPSSA